MNRTGTIATGFITIVAVAILFYSKQESFVLPAKDSIDIPIASVAESSTAINNIPRQITSAASTSGTSSIRTKQWLTVSTGRKSSGGYHVESSAMSADGRWVAFESGADNLVREDSNRLNDIFVLDTTNGGIRRVSVDSSGEQANGHSSQPAISANGSHVVFRSVATNLVANDNNNTADIFMYDLSTGATSIVSLANDSAQIAIESRNPSVSANGKFVAFESRGASIVEGDGNAAVDVFIRDVEFGSTLSASVIRVGGANRANLVNEDSAHGSISADGNWLAFQSISPNLIDQDRNETADIFLLNVSTAEVKRLSEFSGRGGNAESLNPSISSNGRFVVFQSMATDLVPTATKGEFQIFRYDTDSDNLELISVNPAGLAGDAPSIDASVANDGTVAFTSFAKNLVAQSSSPIAAVLVASNSKAVGAIQISRVGSDAEYLDFEKDSGQALLNSDGNKVVFLGASKFQIGGKTRQGSAMFLSVATNTIQEDH